MRVVVDTNILVMSIPRKSKLNPIFRFLINGKFDLCITTEILNEYAEITERMMGSQISEVAMQALINLPNLLPVAVYYNWNLLSDEDDNKFVDCAVASNADYIVTHDKHFNKLSKIYFPEIKVIDAKMFMHLLKS